MGKKVSSLHNFTRPRKMPTMNRHVQYVLCTPAQTAANKDLRETSEKVVCWQGGQLSWTDWTHPVIVGTRDLKYLQFESDPVDSM